MKTKKAVLFCLLVSIMHCWAGVGEVEMTFKVVDDSNKLVSGAKVGISMVKMKNVIGALAAENAIEKQINAVTDEEGKVVLKGAAITPEVYYGVAALPGYYYTRGGEYKFHNIEGGKWQPWNPTVDIVLKPVLNPVPMYAKSKFLIKLPALDKPIGYDLMIGDWVSPYGHGINADFIFKFEREFTNVTTSFNATLTLTFSNEADGIVSVTDSSHSDLRLPRYAVEAGYESQLVKRTYRAGTNPIVAEKIKGQGYNFRVRTKKDEHGKIVGSYYGKISGDISFDFFNSPTAIITFTYYLNPEPNSRNMEFDPNRNLFKNLSPLERVTAP